MQKIDRLGWAAGVSFYAYGLRIGVRVSTAAVLDRVVGCLPHGWEPACSPLVDHLYSLKVGGAGPRPNVRNYTLVYAGLAKLARTMELAEALDALESDLHLYVAEQARNRVFVHAGVVGWQGGAILIPGPSHSGKSTLVAALLRAGASYYSDEFAVLDGRGYVHPFPRRLSLRREAGQPPHRCPAEQLGGRNGTEPLPVSLIALTKYQAGSAWRPQPLSAGRAALAVMRSTVPTLRDPEAALTVLHHVVPAARCLTGCRGEADETAEELLRLAVA
jgi:hypothetical protein